MTSQYFGGSISGGASQGYLSLEKYQDGVMSKEKATLIRNLVHDLGASMKIPAKVDDMSVEQLVSYLKKIVPAPGTKLSAKGHSEICLALADSLNKRHARTVIDTSAPAADVCQATSELLYSLFSGIHTEFISVASDVKRTLGNMTVVRNSLEASFTKLYNTIMESDAAGAKLQAQALISLYKDLLKELDRQMAILAGIINVTLDPTTKTIAELDASNEEFRGFIKALKGDVGTEDFNKKITSLLAGVNHVAILAKQVDDALKAIGATVGDYKKFSDINELVDKLYEIWQSKHAKPSADDIAKFISALDIIRKNDYAHSDIIEHLMKGAKSVKPKTKKRGGAVGDKSLEKRLERQSKTREVLFADFDRRLEQQYKVIMSNVDILSKRIGQSIQLDAPLADFVRAFEEFGFENGMERENFYMALTGYRTDPTSKNERARFIGKLEAVSRSIVPLQKGPSGEYFKAVKEAIDQLVAIIDNFKDMYLKPATQLVSTSSANLSMPDIKAVGGAVDDDKDEADLPEGDSPAEGHASSDLEDEAPKDVKDEKDIESLEESAAKMVPGKLTEGGAKRPNNVAPPLEEVKQQAAAAASQLAASATQAAKEAASGLLAKGLDMVKSKIGGAVDHGSYITLSQAAKHIRFFYRAARVRANLAVAAKDIKAYGKEYETILGDAIGDLVIKAKKEYDELKRRFEDEKKDEGLTLSRWVNSPAMVAPANDPWTGAPRFASVEKMKEYRLSVKENALKLLKEQLDAKIDLLKTVEAIDLYMMNFADAIATNPTEVKELQVLLKSVDIVAKWFTDRSGDSITALFESFANDMAGIHPRTVAKDDAWPQASKEHYYAWVGARIKDVSAPAKKYFPANPFLGVLPGKADDDDQSTYDQIMERAKKAAASVRVLDNIVSTFTKLGTSFGSVKPAEKTFMHAAVMFKNLRKYMFHSSIVMGLRQSNAAGFTSYGADARSNQAQSTVATAAAAGALAASVPAANRAASVSLVAGKRPKMGVDMEETPAGVANPIMDHAAAAAGTDDDRERWARARFSVAMSSILGPDGNAINGFSNTWADTDKLFIMAIKSMVAKVFTVIGSYGVFNKPLDKYSSISTTRLILGGAASTPEIIPGAVELYARLPLLAEFYRDVFSFNDENLPTMARTDGKKISMVPEMEGVWENFVRIVFDDAKYIKEGVYSENHVRVLIQEINIIFKKYGGNANDVITNFVAEVNRRYGVVKQKEIDKFAKEKRRYENADKYAEEERLDFNIMDEKGQTGRRAAPSDRYDTVTPAGERKIENQFSDKYVNLVRDFRDRIDTYIKKLGPHAKSTSFDDTIRQYKLQVENAKDNEEKYRIILKSMQGVDQLNMVNQFKVAMFHESVISPLGTLYAVWTVLNQFSRSVQQMDLAEIEKAIDAHSRSGAAKTYAGYLAALDGKNSGYGRYLHPGFEPDVASGGAVRHYNSWSRASANAGAAANPLVYHGVYGFEPVAAFGAPHVNLTWGLLTAMAANANHADEKVASPIREGIRRFVVDREKLFKDFMNMVCSLGVDLGDLVSIKVQSGNLSLEFGALTEQIVALLTSVKKNLENFRSIIDHQVIKRIEGGASETGSVNTASIYWIEENLVEQILKGNRDGSQYALGLSRINEKISSTFKRFCTPWKVLARVRPGAQPVFDAASDPAAGDKYAKMLAAYEQDLLRDSFERPMAELAYWSAMSRVHAGGAGAVDRAHPMYPAADRWQSNNSRNWPFAIIPHVDDLKGEDSDVKNLKAMDDSLKDLLLQIAQHVASMPAASLAGSGIGQPNMPGSLPQPAPGAAPVGNTGLFFNPSAPGVLITWAAVNSGAHDAKLPVTNAAAGIQELKMSLPGNTKLKELVDAYSGLWNQRDKIRSASMRTPINHRYEWYSDPADAETGAYLLAHKYPAGPIVEAGLLVRLNELLARYLYMGWDATSKKSYAGLINKFANGTHAQATVKGKAINDITYPVTQWTGNHVAHGVLGVPPQHVVVFASLARFMRNLLLTPKRGKPTEFEYRADSLMDIPIHMKENYRAMLPEFDKLFKLVIKKAEALRHVAAQVSLVRQVGFLSSYAVQRHDAGRVIVPGAQSYLTEPWAAGITPAVAYPAVNHALVGDGDVVHLATGTAFLGVGGNDQMPVGWVRGLQALPVAADAASRWMARWAAAPAGAGPFPFPARGMGAYRADMSYGASENFAYEAFDGYVPLGVDASKTWHIALLDDIVSMAASLSKCAMDVYKEVSDEPKFFETHDQAIADYVSLNKRQPLMFLSQAQLAIRNRFNGDEEYNRQRKAGYADKSFMLPVYRAGEAPFKLQYGTRLVLGRSDVKPTLEYMPGVQGLLDKYNGVSTGPVRMEKSAFEAHTVSHVLLLRFVSDLRHSKSVLDSGRGGIDLADLADLGSSLYDTPLDVPAAGGPGVLPGRAVQWPVELRPFAMQNALERVIGFTESSDQDESLKDLLKIIQPHTKTIDSRHSARIFNIIDLNIVPINVHALMREIPLINLINYSYTCDRMIQDTLLPDIKYSGDKSLIEEGYVADSARSLLCKMLLHPYASLEAKEYYGYLARLITGDSGLELGRPKFLGDQLWNRGLLGELYSLPHRTPDESGPRAANAQARMLKRIVEDTEMTFLAGAISQQLVGNLASIFTHPAIWNVANLTDADATVIIRSHIATMDASLRVPIDAAVASNPVVLSVYKNLMRFVQTLIFQADGGVNMAVAPGTGAAAWAAPIPVAALTASMLGAPLVAIPAVHPNWQNAISGNVYKAYETFQAQIARGPALAVVQVLRMAFSFMLYTMAHEQHKAFNGESDSFENNGTLQYFKKEGVKTVVESVSLAGHPSESSATNIRNDLAILGRMRFDTTFVRNLFFLVQLQRVMRLMMRDEVSYLESPVVSSSSVLSRQITEYEGNEMYDSNVFHH